MTDLVNTQTGEVFEIKKELSPFRSITDLKSFKDGEYYEPGSSQVDLTGYEPLESIIARCTRVMRAPGGQTYQVLDVEAVKQEAQVVPTSIDYEAGTASTIDEAFATEDPTSDPDFDLVDASRIMNKAQETLSTLSEDNRGGIAPHIANDDADIAERKVGKSTSDDEDIDEVEKKANEG